MKAAHLRRKLARTFVIAISTVAMSASIATRSRVNNLAPDASGNHTGHPNPNL
jgi:hypothetical protein